MLLHVVTGRHAVVFTEDGGEGGAVGEAAGVLTKGLTLCEHLTANLFYSRHSCWASFFLMLRGVAFISFSV